MYILGGKGMKITTYTIETTATPAQIWQVWQDVENWKNWDDTIEYSRLEGSFQAGSRGTLKLKRTPQLEFVLMEVEPFKKVVQDTSVTLAKVVSTQLMSQVGGKTQVTFEIDIKGPLAFVYALMLRSSIKKKIPKEMDEMVKIAETLK